MIARLRDRDCFVRLRRDGARFRSGPLWCSFVADPAASSTQVGYALSRQVGSAVARNRLRRRLRAIVASTPLPTGLLLIGASTGARPSATELTFEELASHVVDLSRRLPTTP